MRRDGLFWLFACVMLVAAPTRARADASDDVREILSDYRFCKDPKFPLSDSERQYCDVVGDTTNICPTLPAACKHENEVKPPDVDRNKDHDTKASPNETHDDPASHDDSDHSTRIPSLGGFGQILFTALAVVFVLLIARFLWKNVERDRSDKKEESREPDKEIEEIQKPAIVDPIETDVQRLLARARSRAESDPKRAMEDAYAALLRRLEGDGLIHLHPSRTNGDYLRAVRERAELTAAMAGIVRDIERVQFGSDPPTTSGFRSIYERVLPWVGRAALLALIILGASNSLSCSKASHEPVEGGSSTPSGSRAIAELIERGGRKVVYRRVTEHVDADTNISVVLNDASLDDVAKDALIDRVKEDGGTVVFLGNAPRSLELKDSSEFDSGRLLVSASRGTTVLPAPPTGHFDSLPRGATTLLERTPTKFGPPKPVGRGSIYAVRFLRGKGEVIAFADNTLFHNIALVPPANAEFIADLFHHMRPGNVEIYDAWATRGSSSPMASVDNAHLTPILLQLLAAAVLLFVYKGTQFGAPRDARGRSRRSFVEHARAIGVAFRRAKASEHALGLFGVWAFDRLRARGERGNQRGTRHLAHVIAERTGDSESDVLATLHEVRAMRDDASPPSSREAPPSSSFSSRPPPAGDRSSPLTTMAKLDKYLKALSSADRGKKTQ